MNIDATDESDKPPAIAAAVSKKTRFEVFKRDSFACVYCGRAAPEAVLHVDHVKPRVAGGLSDILNLVTACADCNLGKGPRELSDQSTVAKQRASLDELNERRLQLEMLLEWREGLSDIEGQKIAAIAAAIATFTGGDHVVSAHGELHIKKWLKKYSLAELLEAAEAAFQQYFDLGATGAKQIRSWGKAFDAIPKFAGVKRASIDKPYLPDALYVRGILRRRHEAGDLDDYYYGDALELIEAAFKLNATPDSMKAFAKGVPTWDAFVAGLERFCATHQPSSAAPATEDVR